MAIISGFYPGFLSSSLSAPTYSARGDMVSTARLLTEISLVRFQIAEQKGFCVDAGRLCLPLATFDAWVQVLENPPYNGTLAEWLCT